MPRSAAPPAATGSRALENIPGRVVARAARQVLRLRARRRFPPRYPLVEILGRTARRVRRLALRRRRAKGLAACVLLWTLIALTFIDFDTQLLPDNLTLPLLWAGLIANLVRRCSCRSPTR